MVKAILMLPVFLASAIIIISTFLVMLCFGLIAQIVKEAWSKEQK